MRTLSRTEQKSDNKCHYLPFSAIFDHYLPFSAIIFHYLPKCGKCPLPVWYICTVTCQRRSPFGSRSMFDRFPLVLRYFFVRPSFVLRSVSVREARCNGDVTDKEKIRNKPRCKSQRSLICWVTERQRGKVLAKIIPRLTSRDNNNTNTNLRIWPFDHTVIS